MMMSRPMMPPPNLGSFGAPAPAAPPVAPIQAAPPPMMPAPGGFGSLGGITGMTGGAPHPMAPPVSPVMSRVLPPGGMLR